MAWSAEQIQNARIINSVGRQLGAQQRDIQIAIMAAIVESGLRNLNHGDRDSIGMFQQRNAWGSRADRLDPFKSARMFFLGGNAGQRGLLDFKNRSSMGMGQAAQAVQVSAYPDRYAQQQSAAAGLLRTVAGPGSAISAGLNIGNTGIGAGAGPGAGRPPKKPKKSKLAPMPQVPPSDLLGDLPGFENVSQESQVLPAPGSLAASAVPLNETVNSLGETSTTALDELSFDSAEAQAKMSPFMGLDTGQGLPGADPMMNAHLPTLESYGFENPDDTGTSGWRASVVAAARKMLGTPYVWGGTQPGGVDCSGLIYLIYNQRGFKLPRVSADQARSGQRVGFKQLRPGDLVANDNSSRNNGADHIGIYIGNGQVIHAPRPGSNVEITGLGSFGGGWGIRLNRG